MTRTITASASILAILLRQHRRRRVRRHAATQEPGMAAWFATCFEAVDDYTRHHARPR